MINRLKHIPQSRISAERETSEFSSLTTAGVAGSIPGWGRSPGKGNGNPLQFSSLGNLMDRGAWRATAH